MGLSQALSTAMSGLRATQAAMREIFEALTRLLAPILVFTAEEAWGYLGGGGSVS